MTYSRNKAIEMVGTILIDLDLNHPGFGDDGSPRSRANERAAELIEEYAYHNQDQDVIENVPCVLVQNVISGLLDEVEEQTGTRPSMPVAVFS